MQRFWTDEEKELLTKLYPQFLLRNISKDELTAIFNRSFESVSNKASILGIKIPATAHIDVKSLANINKRLSLDIDMDAFKKHMETK